jgi:hypothetical protein
MRIATLLLFAAVAACSKSQTPTTTTPEPTPTGEPASEPATDGGGRPEMTAAACEAAGGKVVGDIGDGAIHQPDYKCADSGAAPMGTIMPDAGGPAAVEGAVCCK